MFYLISIALTQLRYKSLFWYTTDLICAVWVCINWHGKRNGWKCQKFSTPHSIFPLHIQMCRSFCPLQNERNKGSFRSFIRSLHNSDKAPFWIVIDKKKLSNVSILLHDMCSIMHFELLCRSCNDATLLSIPFLGTHSSYRVSGS